MSNRKNPAAAAVVITKFYSNRLHLATIIATVVTATTEYKLASLILLASLSDYIPPF